MLKQVLRLSPSITRNAQTRLPRASHIPLPYPIYSNANVQHRRQSTMSSDSKPFPTPFLPPSVKALSSTPTPKIHLYTAGTPNGFKVHLLLEELLQAYPTLAEEGTIAYDVYSLSFANNDQKTERFLKINPNGRIPAIVDDNAGGHNVFETSSILIWLVEVRLARCIKHRTEAEDGRTMTRRTSSGSRTLYFAPRPFPGSSSVRLVFINPAVRLSSTQLMHIGHGGVGPMQGQANHFL